MSKYAGDGKRWTAEDIKILKNEYLDGTPVELLAEKFHRKKRSIYQKVSRLGLKRPSMYPRGQSDGYIKCKYGLMPSDWNALFDKQEGCCAICGIHQSELKKRLYVDHNNITGFIRGLLCHKCNTGIGLLDTDSKKDKLLLKAIEYIRR